MKKAFITLSITFSVAMSAFGQSITVSPSILSLQSTAVGDVGISAYRANNGGLPVTSGRVLFFIHARGEAGATPNIPNARIIIAAEENFTATSRATGNKFLYHKTYYISTTICHDIVLKCLSRHWQSYPQRTLTT